MCTWNLKLKKNDATATITGINEASLGDYIKTTT